MTKPLPRAILFAVIALIVSAIVSAVVLIAMVGLPGSRDAAAEFQRQAIAQAVQVDLFVGGIVALIAGWLAARPFAGREATVTGLMTGLAFVLADLAIVFLVGNSDRLDLNAMGLSYAVKVAAATLGGVLAGRRATAA
jgi:hypothetical protein